MLLLVTTGATVTFAALVDHVVQPAFLQTVRGLGFSQVVLQYGNETDQKGNHVSKQHLSNALAASDTVDKLGLQISNETNDKAVTTFASPTFSLVVFAYSPDIARYISQADLVVSHAGTGSIVDTLRLKKPLLVVTNLALMDNHQQEVAHQFEKDNYLKSLTTADLADGKLEAAIEQFQKGKLRFLELPSPPLGVVQSVLAEATR